VMVFNRGTRVSAPSLIEEQPWTIMLGSTFP
jgi:hypothetical protein